MCARVVQASGPELLGLRIVNSFEGRDRRGGNLPPRYNAAPSQDLWAIRQHPETGEHTLDLLRGGLIPYWMKAKPKSPPINAKAETVAKLPMFRDAYRKRRCHGDLHRSPGQGLETETNPNFLGIGRDLVVMQDDINHRGPGFG